MRISLALLGRLIYIWESCTVNTVIGQAQSFLVSHQGNVKQCALIALIEKYNEKGFKRQGQLIIN